jgi:uncharacterized protein YdiU (UPF0061 family)
MSIAFDNSYARLPERFYRRLPPRPVEKPTWIRVNEPLALELGIDPSWLHTDVALRALAGNEPPPGADPIATLYAGHQFGSWNPQLGDGRAILLGEVLGRDGQRYDLQLKGSGRTPYSRGGDGRSPLGPVLREYVVSEAMAALGVPTTRALAAVTTGETVHRERPLPGGVLTRVARSHIRVGTFEVFASRGDVEALQLLCEHVLARHYPAQREAERPARALLEQVMARQAALIARWMLLGFVHGVMNTDNMLVSGETIDYGPCAFIDAYDPKAVFSSIDRGGRYAYRNQPGIALWNLASLASALLPLLDEQPEAAEERAREILDGFEASYREALDQGLRAKLGLAVDDVREGDEELAQQLLAALEQHGLDFTLAFRRLAELAAEQAPQGDASVASLIELPEALEGWIGRWRSRLGEQPADLAARAAMLSEHCPALIPRNHQVERVIAAAVEREDLGPFNQLVDGLARPFDLDAERRDLALPPRPEERVTATFCGT